MFVDAGDVVGVPKPRHLQVSQVANVVALQQQSDDAVGWNVVTRFYQHLKAVFGHSFHLVDNQSVLKRSEFVHTKEWRYAKVSCFFNYIFIIYYYYY